jgi:hypothetical protein
MCLLDPVYGNECSDHCRDPGPSAWSCHPNAWCSETGDCLERPEPWEDPGTCWPYAWTSPCQTECVEDYECLPAYICETTPFGGVCG